MLYRADLCVWVKIAGVQKAEQIINLLRMEYARKSRHVVTSIQDAPFHLRVIQTVGYAGKVGSTQAPYPATMWQDSQRLS